MRFIGIDPGLYGAIVSLDAYGLIRYQSLTPIIQKVEGSKGKSEYNLHAMRDALLAAKAEDDSELPAQVIIEQVNAMPHDGVASSFRFGMGFGIWRGLVAALELPIQLVHAFAQLSREDFVVRIIRLLLEAALEEHARDLAVLLIRER